MPPPDLTRFPLDDQLHAAEAGWWTGSSSVRRALLEHGEIIDNLRRGVVAGHWDESVLLCPVTVLSATQELRLLSAAAAARVVGRLVGSGAPSAEYVPRMQELARRALLLGRFKRRLVDTVNEMARSPKRSKK